jgi:hypothetical protein
MVKLTYGDLRGIILRQLRRIIIYILAGIESLSVNSGQRGNFTNSCWVGILFTSTPEYARVPPVPTTGIAGMGETEP